MPLKDRDRDLAILGGMPAFESPLHTNQPFAVDHEDFLRRVKGVLDAGWLTNDGPLVLELEKRLARFLGVEHCVVVANGTLAIQLLLCGLNLSGEVIVPSFTFVATPHAVHWAGLRPVFCDVDPRTWTVDPAHCESLINERTSAILGVHLFGRPCDIKGLAAVAARHNLRLLFDAAHAFACSSEGKMIGGFGDAEVFSFHATKVFQTFEGGAIATGDKTLAKRLQLLRNFGFVGVDTVDSFGTNAKMSEVHAAMGLANLIKLPDIISRCRDVYETYAAHLQNTSGLRLLDLGSDHYGSNYSYVVAEIGEDEAGLSRDQIVDVLQAENVLARRYFYPGCHRMAPYRATGADWNLPQTEYAASRVIVLPAGQGFPWTWSEMCAR